MTLKFEICSALQISPFRHIASKDILETDVNVHLLLPPSRMHLCYGTMNQDRNAVKWDAALRVGLLT
jgi:hypothetical protein